ncbi:MAG: 3-mercaptopyruvate sulfurtransferase [Hyphomicrobiales bacterium]
MRQDWLVSTEWLAEHLNAPDIVVMDASWHLPTENRNGKEEFLEEHIPGALYFDIDDLSDTDTELPHMLPPPEKFASRMRKMGVGDGNRVVVYDTQGLFSAARAWWMFRVFGHQDVRLLDGGFKKWKAEGRPTDFGDPRPRQERHFTARLQSSMVRDKADILRISGEGKRQIVDARSPGRFAGAEDEPRPGLRAGHIPESFNVHYAELLNGDGTLKHHDSLESAFSSAGVDVSKPVVTTCGSGVTAAILTLALEQTGHHDTVLYDGSWTDWGSDTEMPIETGSK